MFRQLKAWIKRRSSREGDLTHAEQRTITGTGHCPDCGGDLRRGPCGGISQNVCCASCHSEFNLTFWDGMLVTGQRISDKGPRELGDRAWCYGL